MASEEVPEELRVFIAESIDSVELLQVLFLLFKNPDKRWSVKEITQELRSAESSIETRLACLYSRGVLLEDQNSPGLHGFLPATPALSGKIKALAEEYEVRPYRIIELIYSRPKDALRAFADAFKLREGKKS